MQLSLVDERRFAPHTEPIMMWKERKKHKNRIAQFHSNAVIMVKEVASKEEFDKIIAESGDKLVAVDYTASWCG